MKTRRARLSFNLADTKASLDMHCAGVSLPLDPSKDSKKQLEQFGFFGSNHDNNKFYPDLNVQNSVTPREEDFVNVPFRLLSATIVGAGTWKATDFSDVRVLRASMDDLNRKPVYVDHETDLHNWVGMVNSVAWDTGGGDVPPGINGVISVDAVVAPKVARGVMQGIIFSNSVTVEFDWVPSHSFSEAYEFENNIGRMHEDGTMIRRVVTEIFNYHESSLVWLGADPFAKLIDGDGNLVHIDKSSVQLSKEDQKKQFNDKKAYSIGFSMPKSVLGLTKRKSFSNNNLNKTEKMLEQYIRNLLGLAADTVITQEHLNKLALKSATGVPAEDQKKLDQFGRLKGFDAEGNSKTINFDSEVVALEKVDYDAINSEVANLKATNVSLTTEKATLTSKVEELEGDAKVGSDFIKLKREETKRLYGIFVEGKTDQSVVDLIDSCSIEQLDGMLAQYTKGMTTKFSVTVKNEKTGEFEFRSSLATPPKEEEPKSSKVTTFDSLREKYSNNSINIMGTK